MATKNSRVTGTDLEQRKWDNRLRKPVEAADIFSQFRGDIIGENVLPGTPFVVVKQSGQTTRVMGLVKALSGAGKNGRDALSGSEEKLATIPFTAYSNEFKHGVNQDRFGIDAQANKPYALLQVAVPLLQDFMEKNLGTHRRQGLLQRYSYNLTVAPTSKAQHWNSNFFVGGVAFSSQPAYSDTLATYTGAIATAMPASPSSTNVMNLAAIKKLNKWIKTQKRIKPYKGQKWIVTVPSNQVDYLMDESTGIGKLTINTTTNKYNLENWIGGWGSLEFVEDIRSPMITRVSSSALTATYTTVDDSRPTVGTANWDVSYILGADAAVELELEMRHLERDNTVEYGREERVGAYANYGVQTLEWSNDTDDMKNYGSAIAVWSSEPS
ncbi:MAG: hypothetical protein GY861_00355 [bacterium]|nr:hypothetical protein [bacterium]